MNSALFLLSGQEIEPYLPSLMETMLSALNNAENLKLKELAVSAIGAIGNFLLPLIQHFMILQLC